MAFTEDTINKDYIPISVKVHGADAATAGNYGKFFIARRPYMVMEISEVHATAGSDGGAVELNIERLQGTEALNAGDEIIKTDFDLKGTANTVQTKKTTDLQNRTLKVGDRLALKDTGTLTAVNDVCVTVYLRPIGRGDYG